MTKNLPFCVRTDWPEWRVPAMDKGFAIVDILMVFIENFLFKISKNFAW